MVTSQDKIRYAATMINEGKVDTIDTLYKYLPKRVVAEILGVNSIRFSNIKSNLPGEFKINEVRKLCNALNIELYAMIKIINNSLPENELLKSQYSKLSNQ
ncbi:MAG: hypothetical protein EOP45_08630 [Sphingobacteriaceae bacterium]|nr:MAG: hypothetical protein EOP45_08630 [Sphingobacteriaceae bacterium]